VSIGFRNYFLEQNSVILEQDINLVQDHPIRGKGIAERKG